LIPSAIVENELADGRLQLLDTDLAITPLTFTASWLASPDIVAVERVASLAADIAQGAHSKGSHAQGRQSVDAAGAAGH